jgi:hypothetical protein
MAARPRLVTVDAEMRRWCALIEEDVAAWPNVSARPMFGLLAFYRGPAIFAAVPRTRAVESPYSIIVKLAGAHGDRVKRAAGPGGDWVAFSMDSEHDVTEALRWIERAYTKAGRSRRHARKPSPHA